MFYNWNFLLRGKFCVLHSSLPSSKFYQFFSFYFSGPSFESDSSWRQHCASSDLSQSLVQTYMWSFITLWSNYLWPNCFQINGISLEWQSLWIFHSSLLHFSSKSHCVSDRLQLPRVIKRSSFSYSQEYALAMFLQTHYEQESVHLYYRGSCLHYTSFFPLSHRLQICFQHEN